MERREDFNSRISFSCIVLCTVFFMILGLLPLLTSHITSILRPFFIMICVLSLHKYYPWGRLKWQFVLMIGYFFVLIIHPLRRGNITAFVSYETFSLFFLLGANRIWSKTEIQMIFKTVVFSSTLCAVTTLASNSLLLRSSSGKNILFLGESINRNSLAFGIAPGVVCGLLLFFYSAYSWRNDFRRIVYFASTIICSATLLLLACRSAFYSSFLGAGCLVWGMVRRSRTPVERLMKRVVLIITAVGGVAIIIRMTANLTSARLFEVTGDNIDTGRNDLWERANQMIKEKPIFGGGYDYWESAGNIMGTHNTFLTLMLAGGIVLGILFIIMLVSFFIECAEIDVFLLMAFMMQMIMHSYTESGLDYYAYIPLMLTFILQRYLKYQGNNLYYLFDNGIQLRRFEPTRNKTNA